MPNKSTLAVIPARAGSKRLPHKNTMDLCGKPLIQWTIEAALACDEITEVIVSTDSVEIVELSKSLGAKVPFIRPENLASDTATSVDVVLHAIDFYQKQDVIFDDILLLQPTSPLRTSQDIKSAFKQKILKKSDAVISVCECEHSPLWCNTLDESHSMDSFLSDFVKKNTRSQDLPPYYRLNGAIYLVNTKRFVAEKNFFLSNNTQALIMSAESSVDIDNLIDFKYADLVMNEMLT